jgi:FixJ family two-component response regulator
MKAGAAEFLTKPFREHELLNTIGQAFDCDREARSQCAEIAELREHLIRPYIASEGYVSRRCRAA